jgi:divalent metal cation (Fe/Co/Zn/Cd) transporter
MADAGALGQTERTTHVRRAIRLSCLTLGWLAIDGVIGMTAGITANSVALIGWGIDCAIEAAAALVIIWRFTGTRLHAEDAERLAQKVVGLSFFLLAPYIIVTALDHLLTGNAAQASWIGIALAASDAVLMPILGRAKKNAGTRLGSAATTGAGHQNILCAYLSVAVLIGLAANALAGWWWADPVAALLAAVVCIQAGTRTWRGESCDELAC